MEFLRHIERCSALVHVVDCATLEPGRDPLSDIDAMKLSWPSTGTVGQAAFGCLNKCDVPEASELADMVSEQITAERGWPVFKISTIAHTGLDPLRYAMAKVVSITRDQQAADEQPQVVVVRPKAVDDSGLKSGPKVRRSEDRHSPARWVRQTDFSNDEAVGYLADRLARLGVEDELLKKGATPGATVIIGDEDNAVVFDWKPSIHAGEPRLRTAGTDPRLEEW